MENDKKESEQKPVEKIKQSVNGKIISKYKPVLVIAMVYCQSCKVSAVPNSLVIGQNALELEPIAEQLHREIVIHNKILCTTPKLLFTTTNGFMDVI